MMSFTVKVIAIMLPLILGANAFAQQSQNPAEETDMEAILAKITGTDPIQRALATQEALNSNNQILRSIALDTALASSDGEVRETALIYLVKVQKQFIITLTMPTDGQDNSNGDLVEQAVIKNLPLTLHIDNFDSNALTMSYSFLGRGNGSGQVGSVTQDGLSFVFVPYGIDDKIPSPCQVVFRGFAKGLLIGALTCGSESFPVTTPVP